MKAEPFTPNGRTRVYLAGPMRGIPQFNFPAFDAAARQLRALGFHVISPHEEDIRQDKLDVTTHKDFNNPPKDFAHYMQRDLALVCSVDVVAVLPGWAASKGAALEVHVARQCGKPIINADSLHIFSDAELDAAPNQSIKCGDSKNQQLVDCGEVRVTDPKTGGQKGQKLERFDLIPGEPLQELARVYGRGAAKYSDDNWRKGYSWNLSFAALNRHLWAWWLGSKHDELGNHHLCQVAWHAFTLYWFQLHSKGTDDRCSSTKP